MPVWPNISINQSTNQINLISKSRKSINLLILILMGAGCDQWGDGDGARFGGKRTPDNASL
jgi:hypothetical protein